MVKKIIKDIPLLYGFIKPIYLYIYRFYKLLKCIFRQVNISCEGDIIILGTGPSLKTDINRVLLNKADTPIMVVNSFCLDDSFCSLKPSFYVLADPGYYNDEARGCCEDDRDIFIQTINNVVNWPITIILPVSGNKSFLVKELRNNKFIDFIFIESNHCIHPLFVKKFISYNKNISTPIFQNVLQMCLYYCIYKKYQNIFVFGADHNWCKDIMVTEDNVVAINENHCYGYEHHKVHPLEKLDGAYWNMGELFEAWMNVYKGYYDLYNYANYNCVKIFNESSVSFVDAFPRKSGRF